MSDSYVLAQAGTQVKRRKPPKKPNRRPSIIPWWCSATFVLHFGIGYGLSASAQQVGNAIAFGVCLAIYGYDLLLWWRWRRWSRFTGAEIPSGTGDRGLDEFHVALFAALTGFLLTKDVLTFLGEGKLPGQ